MPQFTCSLDFIVRCLLAITVTLVIASAVGLMVLRTHSARLLSVQTASMAPTFRPGDALIVMPVKVKDLHLGEVISYQTVQDSRVIISHRLVGIDNRTGWLTTAGDALRTTDKSIPPSQLVGRAVAVILKFGLVLDFLRHPIGLALSVYLPAILIVVTEARRLTRTYARPFYSVRL